MATTTPNFGWPVPTSTDLVKDGATAMEALGDAIDTSMVDLKGGTTGQVLAKASNTDMDFSWTSPNPGDITAVTAGTGISGGGTSGDVTITNSMATAIDAKGDLIAGTGADAFSRLAAGNNGEALVADSSTSTGLRYQGSIAGGKNFIINGAFDNWQRGTSFASPFPAYTADRYAATPSAGGTAFTVSQQASFLASSRYCLRFQRNSGQTGTAQLFLGMAFETTDVVKMQGKTMTWSFYAKAGSNFSPTSSTLGVSFSYGTGIDQGPFVGHTGEVNLINTSQVITTTATRYSYTFTVPTTATSMRWNFNFAPTGTAGTNDFYEVTNMQLELGSVATEFSRAGGTIAGELAACQRYYWRQTATGGDAYFGNGNAGTTTEAYIVVKHPQTMRVAPTSIDYNGLNVQAITASQNATSANITNAGTDWTLVRAIVASGLTATTQPYMLRALSSSSNYLGLSAEL